MKNKTWHLFILSMTPVKDLVRRRLIAKANGGTAESVGGRWFGK